MFMAKKIKEGVLGLQECVKYGNFDFLKAK